MISHPNRSKRSVKSLDDGSRIPLQDSRLGGDVSVTLGALYRPHPEGKGEERVEFCRGKTGDDWYIWSVHRQQRIESYSTRRELEAAWSEWTADYSPVPVVAR